MHSSTATKDRFLHLFRNFYKPKNLNCFVRFKLTTLSAVIWVEEVTLVAWRADAPINFVTNYCLKSNVTTVLRCFQSREGNSNQEYAPRLSFPCSGVHLSLSLSVLWTEGGWRGFREHSEYSEWRQINYTL